MPQPSQPPLAVVTLRIVRSCRIPGREGLHARPAARVVETAKRFAATITFVHGAARASAKDLMDLLSLAASGGSVITVEAEGEDAESALRALEDLFRAMGEGS